MANRLETFKTLATTYVDEIDKLEGQINNSLNAIDALRQQLEAEETRHKSLVDEQRTTITQLKGITVVIRAMEDRDRERRIAHEMQIVAAARELEDKAYE